MDIKIDKNTVIVFDLDDTLYNELDYLKSAFRHISQQLEPKDWKTLYVSMFSLYRCKENVFDVLTSKYHTDNETLMDMYRFHFPQISLFNGVLDVIKTIKTKNGKIGIITDGRSQTQRAKIKSLGILNLIDKIIISDEIGTEKPDQINFKAIEDAFSGNNYCYIADNLKKDFVAPNSLGWKTIGLIDNGKNIHIESHRYMDNEHKPQEYILSFSEINII
jgi:putative hydrolase of the HAD superfamily